MFLQVADGDAHGARGAVDEPAVAEVDANVTDGGQPGVVKIKGRRASGFYTKPWATCRCALGLGAGGGVHPHVLEHIGGKTGTVKALGAFAAGFIGRAQIARQRMASG